MEEQSKSETANKKNKQTSFILAIILSLIILCLLIPLIIFSTKINKKEKKIILNFLGDSITEGFSLEHLVNDRFTTIIANTTKSITNNYSVGGTRIARQLGDEKDFNYRVLTLDNRADFTFVFGGTNDYGHGLAELGNKNSQSVYTFYGGMYNLIRELLKKFKRDQICFIIPIPRFNEDKHLKHGPLQVYRDIMIEVLSENNIDYLILKDEFPDFIPEGPSEYFNDGLHPNFKGHKVIANAIIKYLVKKNIL